eukprot:Lithocolla_globosa_v1_NODE_1_length_16663_cov_42.954359.p4 type:complete len:408 gc:universal NODE_1_length_16663_cov_42.954359:4395-5618(+)
MALSSKEIEQLTRNIIQNERILKGLISGQVVTDQQEEFQFERQAKPIVDITQTAIDASKGNTKDLIDVSKDNTTILKDELSAIPGSIGLVSATTSPLIPLTPIPKDDAKPIVDSIGRIGTEGLLKLVDGAYILYVDAREKMSIDPSRPDIDKDVFEILIKQPSIPTSFVDALNVSNPVNRQTVILYNALLNNAGRPTLGRNNNRSKIIKKVKNWATTGSGLTRSKTVSDDGRDLHLTRSKGKPRLGELTVDESLLKQNTLHLEKESGEVVYHSPISKSFRDLLFKSNVNQKILEKLKPEEIDLFRKLTNLAQVKYGVYNGKGRIQRGLPRTKKDKNVFYTTPSKLKERLEILVGSVNAGNDSNLVKQEISKVIDALLELGTINQQQHKAILNQYVLLTKRKKKQQGK